MAPITTTMRLVKRLAVAGALVLGVSGPVVAGVDEGVAAFERGDYETAYKEMLRLAQAGNARAQFNLGVMYYNGVGVPQDYAEAAKWYKKAAEQGRSKAQNNLGHMYASGQGVPQDYIRAYLWWNLAAAQGDQHAAYNRDIMAKDMTPADISKAKQMAREWKPKPSQPRATSVGNPVPAKEKSEDGTPPCRDVGGYEAYMTKTGKVCQLD